MTEAKEASVRVGGGTMNWAKQESCQALRRSYRTVMWG